MSIIINLFGGPGTGKSTLAAELFAELKKRGATCELVREYVKEWAWEERKFGKYDQFYFLGKQTRKESLVYGKVDYVITDSPILIAGFYAELVNNLKFVTQAAFGFLKEAEKDGHKYVNFYLPRTVKYEQHGRFQDEAGARRTDDALYQYLVENFVDIIEVNTPLDERVNFILNSVYGQNKDRKAITEGVTGA